MSICRFKPTLWHGLLLVWEDASHFRCEAEIEALPVAVLHLSIALIDAESQSVVSIGQYDSPGEPVTMKYTQLLLNLRVSISCGDCVWECYKTRGL